MSDVLNEVSIVIPKADSEPALDALLEDLKPLNNEIIISSKGTRAKSLNQGAARACNRFLWFLHADSRICAENLTKLQSALETHPDALHYFDLVFDANGLPALNAWGANMRSRLFGTPYGDQGFCISKHMFDELGGYREDVAYCEDLLFVWRARQSGVKLNRIRSGLVSSARKYKTHGWLKLTLVYQWRWIGMSIPEALKLIRAKS